MSCFDTVCSTKVIITSVINSLNPIAHFWLHHGAEKMVSVRLHVGSLLAEKMGQGEVGGVTRRVTCKWWQLGLAVKVPWLGLDEPILALTASTGLENVLSPGREDCLGSEGVLLRSWVRLLRLEVDLGSVLESEREQKWRYSALKTCVGYSNEKNSGIKGFKLTKYSGRVFAW